MNIVYLQATFFITLSTHSTKVEQSTLSIILQESEYQGYMGCLCGGGGHVATSRAPGCG